MNCAQPALPALREKLSGMSVLYVEDEAELREHLEQIFRHLFREVRLASNGQEGLEAYREHPADMVISDIIMPGMDGIEMVRQIRKIDPRQTAVFLSATTDTFHFAEIVRQGADGFILKPLSRAQLFACLDKAADQLTARREAEKYRKELEARVKAEVEKNMRQTRMLEHQSRLAQMGEMLAAVSHQWKQPINVIGLTADDLLEEYRYGNLDEKYLADGINFIHDQLKLMVRINEDFRSFYSPSSEKRRFPLSRTVEASLRLMEPQFRHREIRVETAIRSDGEALGHENEISQVVMNFIGNARDACDLRGVDAPMLTVEVECREGWGRIGVTDNGGGIPSEAMEQLFQPYFSTKGEKGSGIGLYISRLIAEKHEGRVGFENVEGGARFYLELPLAE